MSLFTAKEISRYSLTKALSEISNQSEPGFHGVATGLEAGERCVQLVPSQLHVSFR